MFVTTLKALLGSKKFLSAAAGVLAIVGVRYLGLSEEQATEIGREILGVIAALLVGQGAADLGKEAKTRESDGIMALAEAGFSAADAEDDESF